jgi:hypothetical protein
MDGRQFQSPDCHAHPDPASKHPDDRTGLDALVRDFHTLADRWEATGFHMCIAAATDVRSILDKHGRS